MRDAVKPAGASSLGARPGFTTMALQRRNLTGVILLVTGAILLIMASVWLFWESRRFEPVVIALRDIPAGRQITATDLAVMDLPVQRPESLRGFREAAAVIGQYAEVAILANSVIVPRMVQPDPPTTLVYPNGRSLPPEMVAVPIKVAELGPLTDRDVLNIGFISDRPEYCDRVQADRSGAIPPPAAERSDGAGSTAALPKFACRWASALPIVYLDQETKTAYVAMTPAQSLAYHALRAAEVELWMERYSAAGVPLQYLDRRYPNQVTLAELTDPASVTVRVEPRRQRDVLPDGTGAETP